MEPKNWWFVDVSPFPFGGIFRFKMFVFEGVMRLTDQPKKKTCIAWQFCWWPFWDGEKVKRDPFKGWKGDLQPGNHLWAFPSSLHPSQPEGSKSISVSGVFRAVLLVIKVDLYLSVKSTKGMYVWFVVWFAGMIRGHDSGYDSRKCNMHVVINFVYAIYGHTHIPRSWLINLPPPGPRTPSRKIRQYDQFLLTIRFPLIRPYETLIFWGTLWGGWLICHNTTWMMGWLSYKRWGPGWPQSSFC